MAQELESPAAVAEEVVETAPDNSQAIETTENNDAEALYEDDLPPEEDVESDEEVEEQAEAVVAPASLNAEEKEQFAQLPPDAQRAMSDIFQRRDREIQQGLEAARSAQRTAERTAADQTAQMQQHYAQQFNQLVQAFAPQPPPPELAQADPARYIALKAQFDHDSAQYGGLVQTISGMSQQSNQHFANRSQEWMQDQIGQLRSVPEFADDTTRQQFLEGVKATGLELGYTEDSLHQADATDLIALNKVRAWKSDAEKWRTHQKRRNERPRVPSGRFASAPAGNGAASNGAGGVNNTLQALYPND